MTEPSDILRIFTDEKERRDAAAREQAVPQGRILEERTRTQAAAGVAAQLLTKASVDTTLYPDSGATRGWTVQGYYDHHPTVYSSESYNLVLSSAGSLLCAKSEMIRTEHEEIGDFGRYETKVYNNLTFTGMHPYYEHSNAIERNASGEYVYYSGVDFELWAQKKLAAYVLDHTDFQAQ